MEPTKCNHTYTTKGRRVFRCDAAPHPSRPDQHYFVRDTALEDMPAGRRHLVVIPGQRGEQ